MRKNTRDLLVLFKSELMTPKAMEEELVSLHDLLYQVERIDTFVTAHELIDLVKYKVVGNSVEIKKLLRQKKEQPFVFLNNKN